MATVAIPYQNEVNKINSVGIKGGGFSYKAVLHLMSSNQNYTPLKVVNMDIIRDYDKQITDDIEISLAVTPGTWTDHIMPQIDNLEMTVYRYPTGNPGGKITPTRYKAYCKDAVDYRKRNTHLQKATTEELDRSDIVIHKFQLVPVLIEKLLTVQVGTIFNDCTVGDALSAFLVGETGVIPTLPDEEGLRGLDMVPPDNKTVYKTIPIPQGINLLSLPVYMQKQLYGIYNGGLNHYIQNGIWYVYPKFKMDVESGQSRYANIYTIYRDTYRYAEKTFMVEGKDVSIIGTLENEIKKSTAANALNHGNGLRIVNQKMIGTDAGWEVKGNKARLTRSKNVSEWFLKEEAHGVRNAKVIQERGINPYEITGSLEARHGNVYAINWHNASPDRIAPGTIVKVHYIDSNETYKQITGILMKAHYYIQSLSDMIAEETYGCSGALFIYSKD